jgi:hypothetical protein
MRNDLRFLTLSIFLSHIVLCPAFAAYPAPGKACLACHKELEPIRQHEAKMSEQIYAKGKLQGDPNGCVVCHGGNPKETEKKELAHKGAPVGNSLETFVTDPGSIWVAGKVCGSCHPKYVYAMHRSLMQTEAGKIHGGMWGYGLTGYEHEYGNYNIKDTDGPVPVFGTEVYSQYIQDLMAKFPNVFPNELRQVPEVDVSTLKDNPKQAIFSFLRSSCLRCHVGVKGQAKRGNYRGMGCSSCHIPYSNEGYYEGADPSIPKDESDHMLVHSIQSTREAKVTVHGKTYSGIPQETCATCHNMGKRIGVSYQGLMESPYGTPYDEDGEPQPKLHTKRYTFVRDDHHHSVDNRKENPAGSMLCQDCHVTTSVHGNGNISCTTLGSVEVECSDCHGTPDEFPWELPIGFGDEFERTLDDRKRGLATNASEEQSRFGTLYPAMDGYLLTTRGNPFGNVVKDGGKVILHSASGVDLQVPLLKKIKKENTWQNPKKATTAMCTVKKHVETMECYTCHSTWAPQCYGCHVRIDFSNGKKSTDWVASGSLHGKDGQTAESRRDGKEAMHPGATTAGLTYSRWEDPVLGVNGEGRVTPIIPGCQLITTLIGPDGETLNNSEIWRTPAGTENGGEEGQRTFDMSPIQPHTVTRDARPCVSCHGSAKALGYGVHDNKYMKQFLKDLYIDLTTSQGELLSSRAVPQVAAIDDLPMDLSQVVTREGKQVQTVGEHWPGSRPLSQAQRDNMERVGVCIACHQDVPDGTPPLRMINKIRQLAGIPKTDEEHSRLVHKILSGDAEIKIYGMFAGMLFFGGIAIYLLRRYTKRK